VKIINENDPPPFTVLNANGKASMLLVCDHASPTTPQSMEYIGLDESIFKQHVAVDIGAEDVTRILSERLDAAAVLAGYSRLLIDVNRQPGDLSSIPEKSDTTIIPGNLRLSDEQRLARVDSVFWPYHQTISKILSLLRQRGPVPALISVHSFTPFLNGDKRHWDIGVLWNRDPRLAIPLLEKLKAFGSGRYYIGNNEPYSGREFGYTLDIHAGVTGLPNCAIEIRQDLIDTHDGAQYWANTLADILRELLAHNNIQRVERF